MKKYLSIAIVIIVLFVIGFAVFKNKKGTDDRRVPPTEEGATSPEPTPVTAVSPLDISYTIEDEVVTLKNGTVTERPDPAVASEVTTEVFGKPVYGNIGMGDDTAVMFLDQETSGTGIFFYVVAAYKEGGVYKGSNAVFIGDRIAPKNITIKNSKAEINYAVRKDSDPMTEEPSVGVTKRLILEKGVLKEVK